MKPWLIFILLVSWIGASVVSTDNIVIIPSPAAGANQTAVSFSSVGTTMGWTPVARSFNEAPSHSIQTIAAQANGFQISSTRDCFVTYSTTIQVSATIGAASSGYIVLELAETNSATASDWKEIGRFTNGETVTLAIVLQDTSLKGGALFGLVPAGYYARLRSVDAAGSPTYAYVSGEEVLL